MKLEGVIKTLKLDIRDKQGELHRLRSGPDIYQHKESKPTDYEPPMSCAKSLEYLEKDRSPGYLDRRDNDEYSLESSESDRDENKKDKEDQKAPQDKEHRERQNGKDHKEKEKKDKKEGKKGKIIYYFAV